MSPTYPAVNTPGAVWPGQLKGYVDGHGIQPAAAGDGTTDDTTAIQNAINQGAANGAKVIIPGGTGTTYRVDGTLVIPRRVEVEIAAGAIVQRQSTASSSTAPIFRLDGNEAKLTGRGRIEMQNGSPTGVVLIGPPNLTTLANVLSAQVNGVVIQGVKATGNIGIKLWSSFVANGGATYQNVVRDVTLDGFGTGIYASDVANANEFHGIQWKNVQDYCVDFNGNTASRGADENAVIGGFVTACPSVTVIRLRNVIYNQFVGIRAEPGGTAVPYNIDATSLLNTIVMSSNMTGTAVDANGGNTAIVNGTVLSLQGSQTAPGIAFNGDPSTGFFRQATNVLSATTGGTERFRLGANLSMLTNLQVNTNYLEFQARGTTPSTPASGFIRMFLRSSDGALCYVNSAGTVKVVTVT